MKPALFTTTPGISIIITVKNEEKHIGKLLESLLVQDCIFEVVIVDSESTDGTEGVISLFLSIFPCFMASCLLPYPFQKACFINA